MKKIFILVVTMVAVLAVASRGVQDTDGSVIKLAQSLEQLSADNFIELLGAAIGKEHLHLLDADRNIYRIDVPQATIAKAIDWATYFFWDGYILRDLLMSDLAEASAKYARLMDKKEFDLFAHDVEDMFNAYDIIQQGGENLTTILSDKGPSFSQSPSNVVFKLFSDLIYIKLIEPTIFEPLEKYAALKDFDPMMSGVAGFNVEPAKKLGEVFGTGIRGSYEYMFENKNEHYVLFYVYRYRDTLYGFYVDSLDNASWDDGKTAAIAQKIMDDWRVEQKKRVS